MARHVKLQKKRGTGPRILPQAGLKACATFDARLSSSHSRNAALQGLLRPREDDPAPCSTRDSRSAALLERVKKIPVASAFRACEKTGVLPRRTPSSLRVLRILAQRSPRSQRLRISAFYRKVRMVRRAHHERSS